MDYRQDLRVLPGAGVALALVDAEQNGGFASREAVEVRLRQLRGDLKEVQTRLYAERKRSVLICLQGMDSAGKDGVINNVLSAMNPQGCRVASFKQPNATEKAHDVLWRYHQAMPEHGWVQTFNRSHYESVVADRVQGIVDVPICKQRYNDINAFEDMLVRSGTVFIKLFLHISKAEQLARFKARLDDPLKRWKISESDYLQRALWDENMAGYQDAISQTSTAAAPWYVIPSNRKWFRDLATAEIVTATLTALEIAVPEPTVNIDDIRRRYHEEVRAQKGTRT
jgi:PPK2 family polyphosphate:nucleotide phosphotransferase